MSMGSGNLKPVSGGSITWQECSASCVTNLRTTPNQSHAALNDVGEDHDWSNPVSVTILWLNFRSGRSGSGTAAVHLGALVSNLELSSIPAVEQVQHDLLPASLANNLRHGCACEGAVLSDVAACENVPISAHAGQRRHKLSHPPNLQPSPVLPLPPRQQQPSSLQPLRSCDHQPYSTEYLHLQLHRRQHLTLATSQQLQPQ